MLASVCITYAFACVLGRNNVCIYVLMIKPIMRCDFFLTLWIDVACLAWRQRIADQADSCHGRTGFDHCRMKLCLQKRLGADMASFGKTSRLLFWQILYGLQCVPIRQSSRGTW